MYFPWWFVPLMIPMLALEGVKDWFRKDKKNVKLVKTLEVKQASLTRYEPKEVARYQLSHVSYLPWWAFPLAVIAFPFWCVGQAIDKIKGKKKGDPLDISGEPDIPGGGRP